MKNRKKMVLKTMCFFDIEFSSLFFDFSRFWLDFGRPWALQKLKKIRKNRFLIAFSFEGGFWEGLGRVLGGFWKTFEKFFGVRFSKAYLRRFFRNFSIMLTRATLENHAPVEAPRLFLLNRTFRLG